MEWFNKKHKNNFNLQNSNQGNPFGGDPNGHHQVEQFGNGMNNTQQWNPFGGDPNGHHQVEQFGNGMNNTQQWNSFGEDPNGNHQVEQFGNGMNNTQQWNPFGGEPNGNHQVEQFGNGMNNTQQWNPFGGEPNGHHQVEQFGNGVNNTQQWNSFGEEPNGHHQVEQFGNGMDNAQQWEFEKGINSSYQNKQEGNFNTFNFENRITPYIDLELLEGCESIEDFADSVDYIDGIKVYIFNKNSSKNLLMLNKSDNNASFKTSKNYNMYLVDSVLLRSRPEVRIYNALKEAGVLFFPNSRAVVCNKSKEPDFIVIIQGQAFYMNLLNNHTHTPENDANDTRFYQDHGIFTRPYCTSDCERNPHGVVEDFLNWVKGMVN
ncbi:hypothetical protein LCM00_13670 [Bacillus infantis]|uniref:hypothetical protein n=1 Tax=Bacillus infantis TaxID=324767 RepID=UPI001CD46AF4|nr:hypothetical protein [Bacillus infantis]MCA1040555.1 hypothetical protein [Bacillus infantis]